MELLWYQFVKLDGSLELIPERSIARVKQVEGHTHVYLIDGTTLSFNGTVESLFGSIAAETAALGIVTHVINYQEQAP